MGPKTYTYTVVDADGKVHHVEIKAKGISLSAKALELVTAETMEKLTGHPEMQLRVPQFRISRDMNKCRLYSQIIHKRFAHTSTKRIPRPGGEERLKTLPYGYGADPTDADSLSQLLDAVELAISQS